MPGAGSGSARCPVRSKTTGTERMDVNIKDFEAAITELESVVKKLEDGELTLEQSLELYERGVTLSRYCHSRLEQAERRIEILTEGGALKPAPDELSDTADDGNDRDTRIRR